MILLCCRFAVSNHVTPMRYTINKRNWSLARHYTITAAEGGNVYIVQNKFLTVHKKMRFMDMSERELFRIAQHQSTYRIGRDDKLLGTVEERPSFLESVIDITLPGSENIVAEANRACTKCTFTRGRLWIATMSRKWWANRCGMDIIDSEDDEFLLACAVVVDVLCDFTDRQ